MRSFFYNQICCVHICLIFICLVDLNAQDVFSKYYEDPEWIDVGSNKQLFVDDYLIEYKKSVDYIMNPPYQTGEILIEADLPHERGGYVFLYSSILKGKDEKIQVWYDFVRQKSDDPYDHDRHVGYAESTDGINFIKPNVGLYS
jgi:hypothetical protein